MSLNTFKFIKLKKKCQDILYNSINDNLNIINSQSYIPAFSKYNNFDNDFTKKMFIFNNKYLVLKIEKINNDNSKSNYKIDETLQGKLYAYLIDKNIYTKSKDYNSYKNYIKKTEIFVKSNPLLNVISYMENKFTFDNNMPSINSYLTNNIINNSNNNAYIEIICCYFLNLLGENELTTLFPHYFGSFNGLSKSFVFDISEDYEYIKDTDWFSMKNNKLNYEIITYNNLNEYQDIELHNIELLDYDNEKKFNKIKKKNSSNSIDLTTEILEIFNSNLESKNNTDINENENNKKKLNNNCVNHYDENSSDESPCDTSSIISIDTDSSCMLSETCIRIKNYPVQCLFMEKFNLTLTEYAKKDLTNKQWKSILFEISFGLAVAQKHLKFVHNDLHSDNIMFKDIKENYKYYKYNNLFFKVPTFNKETKIIDFARGIIKIGSKLYFSDVFKKGGDAYGQYNYLNKKLFYKHKYINYNFDLARLALTLLKYLDFSDNLEIEEYLNKLILLKNNKYIDIEEDEFSVYIELAKNSYNSLPKNQLILPIFNEFVITENEIPEKQKIYQL